MRIILSVAILHVLFITALVPFHLKKKVNKTYVRLKVHETTFRASEKKESLIAQSIPPEPVICEEEAVEPPPLVVEPKQDEVPNEAPVVEVLEKETFSPPPKQEVVKKIEAPKPKQIPKKKAIAKSSTTPAKKPSSPQKKKPVIPKSTPKPDPNREKLYALMQESLKNLSAPKSSGSTSSSKVRGISNLPALASEALKFEASYQDSLVSLLEERLEFPEKGAVKIKLTLKKEGEFKSLEVLHSASEKNTKYLQTALQNMVFPSLQKFFPKEDTHTFLITLTSEKSH